MVGIERELELAHELGQGIFCGKRPAHRGQGLRLRPGARSIGSAARRGRDQDTHDSTDEQEDHERDQVFTLGDREFVQGRREVPVGEQEATDRADEGGDEAAPPLPLAWAKRSAMNVSTTSWPT